MLMVSTCSTVALMLDDHSAQEMRLATRSSCQEACDAWAWILLAADAPGCIATTVDSPSSGKSKRRLETASALGC